MLGTGPFTAHNAGTLKIVITEGYLLAIGWKRYICLCLCDMILHFVNALQHFDTPLIGILDDVCALDFLA